MQFTFVLNYLKNLKTILRNSRLLDQFFYGLISTLGTGKYSDNGCKEGDTIITNDQSEFSLCAIPFSDTALITN